jgi:hypothetical protein
VDGSFTDALVGLRPRLLGAFVEGPVLRTGVHLVNQGIRKWLLGATPFRPASAGRI